ncbi:type IX secretion system sortase PorU [Chitinophaga sp. ysch24]|uniref:Type IX secretion system sortase PorU n=1 Tax=Chitinophaga tropicalis TaxID=2683588 RepID=A0A7K1TZJ8_9BACT|nr:type IX secretion system sortase PorU [Chitinophaga tropicalis]
MFVTMPYLRTYFLCCLMLSSCRLVLAGNGGGGPYAAHSVLAEGTWFKLAVTREGIYKIDKALLSSMGISGGLNTIRLYGTGGQMLPESNAAARYDDLPEVALMEEGDYLLFYAPGPHSWSYRTGSFFHSANLYSDTSYYFLRTGAGGRRISTDQGVPANTLAVSSFDYRNFYENDSLNFLASGKQWWGTVFNSAQPLRRIDFTLPVTPASLKVDARVAARGFGNSSFAVDVNGSNAGTLSLSAVSGNIFESYASVASGSFTATPSGTSIPVTLRFTPGGSGGQGWLDYLVVSGRCPLQLPAQEPLFFRDAASVNANQTALFTLANANSQTVVWDITDPLQPVRITTKLTGSTLSFSRDCSVLHEYAAFAGQGYQAPRYTGPVANQDLHGIEAADMLIITTPALQSAASRLAAWHSSHDGLTTRVVNAGDIYTEFASGSPDPVAIRDFVKMCYDRGGLKYLLLFGDASYDYKHRLSNNTNMVPTWQSAVSTDPIYAYPSDDFFGFLDDADDINDNGRQNLLDIAIGRLPVQSAADANIAVNKIIRYHDPASFGRWQQHITFVADDGDANLHLQDAESMSTIAAQQWPAGNINKIYLDAYPKVADAGGSRYPAVNAAIAEDIYNGTLIWNYTGHGSYTRLAEEVIMEESSLSTWKNAGKLPLFITATCDFAPFDNPAYTSLGEKVLLKENGGGIALMTTTRAVFSASNKVLNANYLQQLLTPGPDGRMLTLGQAAMEAKNQTYITYTDIPNNRKFQLLGDPALTLAFPRYHVVTDSLNGKAMGDIPDTLKAMGACTIKGHLEDEQGRRLDQYNGMLYTTVYDKPVLLYTRGNDAGSSQTEFYQQQNILFRGSQTIKNGHFSCSFVVPADIDYQAGAGSIDYYATDGSTTAGGAFSDIQVGGTAGTIEQDTRGPVIKGYMDNEYFRNGGMTGENTVLFLRLYDEHGINTSGYGIGHDLVATLDSGQYYILNNFFEAAADDYRNGSVSFPFSGLSEGLHRLTIKAWDTYNNSNTATLDFNVAGSSQLAVERVSCYPNPFSDRTWFAFSHNQQGQALDITIRIFTVMGQQIKTIHHTINAAGSRYVGAYWNGTNDAGSKVLPGIYIYNMMVTANGKTKVLGGKVILL